MYEVESENIDEPETERREKGESVPGIAADASRNESFEENVEIVCTWAWMGKVTGPAERVLEGFFPASEVSCSHQRLASKPSEVAHFMDPSSHSLVLTSF